MAKLLVLAALLLGFLVYPTMARVGGKCSGESGCGTRAFCEHLPGTCRVAHAAGTCASIPEVCPMVFAPVCGCNGKTYGNDCERRAAGVSKAHDGKCP